jgi:hypothetical protein
MGDIHSKKRNQLSERVCNMAVIKISIQCQHAASAPKKLKRKRSERENAPILALVPSLREKTLTPINNSSTSDDDAPAENDSGAVVKELAALAWLDDDADVDLTLTKNPPPPAILRQLNIQVVPSAGDAPMHRSQMRPYFGTKESITLADLFDFGLEIGNAYGKLGTLAYALRRRHWMQRIAKLQFLK